MLVLVVLCAIPGGLILFMEPKFGDVTDMSGLNMVPGPGTLTVSVSREYDCYYALLRYLLKISFILTHALARSTFMVDTWMEVLRFRKKKGGNCLYRETSRFS